MILTFPPRPHFLETINMLNLKQMTLTLAIAAAATVGTSASAAVQTVDAVGYTFSYDDSFWGTSVGTTFSNSGNVFTFANLGYESSSAVARSGSTSSDLYDSFDSAVSVSAKSGYEISGITTGATGRLSAISGPAADSVANAIAFSGTYWSTNVSGRKPGPEGYVSVFASGGDTSKMSTYSTSDAASASANFYAGTTQAVGNYIAWLYTDASKGGSSAYASQDTASFAVAVTAVPEPETYAMLLAGLGLVGAIARRRETRAKG